MSQKKRLDRQMLDISFDEQAARQWIDEAETREGYRSNQKRPDARAALARKWGISFWSLTNFRRGRLKDLRGAMRDKIMAGVVREIEQEINRLTHDLEMVRRGGARLSSVEMAEVQTALNNARALLGSKT